MSTLQVGDSRRPKRGWCRRCRWERGAGVDAAGTRSLRVQCEDRFLHSDLEDEQLAENSPSFWTT